MSLFLHSHLAPGRDRERKSICDITESAGTEGHLRNLSWTTDDAAVSEAGVVPRIKWRTVVGAVPIQPRRVLSFNEIQTNSKSVDGSAAVTSGRSSFVMRLPAAFFPHRALC